MLYKISRLSGRPTVYFDTSSMSSNISEVCRNKTIVFSAVVATAAGVCAVLCSLLGAFLNLSTIAALLNYSK